MNERLINEVAVGVVFVQGPTKELKMTRGEIIRASAEVQDGCALLAGLEPDARISWAEDYRTIDIDKPIFPGAPWKGMPKDFYIQKIDAALWRESNNKIYLFQGDKYIRLTGSTMDSGYPKTIAGHWHGLPPDFEDGIDAAFWRKSNGKIYMFKGDQYVRLTETQVDSGYPKPIAGNWHGLPSGFEAGIDAAFMHVDNGKIYMFKGDEYVRLTGTTVDDEYPKPIKGNLKGLPDYYEEGRITAALWRGDNQRVYLFGREERNDLNTYVRYTDITKEVDSGYPKYVGGLDEGETEALWRDPAQVALGVPTGEEGYKKYVEELVEKLETDWGFVVFVTKYPTFWGGYANTPKIVMRWKVGDDNFDRVFAHETGHMFGAPDEYAAINCNCKSSFGRFFDVKNGNCELCSTTLSMSDGYPYPIAGHWKGLPASFTSGIDAAVWHAGREHAYLFKGAEYVRLTGTTMDSGYPKPIAGNWQDLPASFTSGIDAALWRPSNSKLYFFKGSQYARLTGTKMDSGYPKPIEGHWHGVPASFAAGIDAATTRDSNGKIYLFKGNQYVRLTETTMDDGYPRSIAAHWHGLPASFTSGIDAGLMHSERKAMYLFKGNEYVRMINGVSCLMSVNSAVVCSYSPAHLGWEAFLTGIDASVTRGDNGKTYLFSGKWYARYSKIGDPMDQGYPKPIAGNWQGLPDSFQDGIDAALWRESNGKTYFFKGAEYVRLTGPKVDDGYPRPIAGNWNGIPNAFQSGIDAAFWRKSNGKIYLFKGSEYVRLTDTTMDPGYPKPISTWDGLPASWADGIDSALMRLDTNQIYFFRGRRYLRYSNVEDGPDSGYPAWIDKNWMPFPRG